MRIQRDGETVLLVGGPVPRGAAAITLGRVVSVRRGQETNRRLMRHEAEHTVQYARDGMIRFLARYVRGYLFWRGVGYGHWAAYRRIPYEAEAEWSARRAYTLDSVPRS